MEDGTTTEERTWEDLDQTEDHMADNTWAPKDPHTVDLEQVMEVKDTLLEVMDTLLEVMEVKDTLLEVMVVTDILLVVHQSIRKEVMDTIEFYKPLQLPKPYQ